MISFSDGDYWGIDADVRVITVNTVGVMGKGIALEAKNRWGELELEYQKLCKGLRTHQQFAPGDVWGWLSPAGTNIILVATKEHWRDNSRYEWIRKGLQGLRNHLEQLDDEQVITIPALGCGNGKLEWKTVAGMIVTQLKNLPHQIYVFNPR